MVAPSEEGLPSNQHQLWAEGATGGDSAPATEVSGQGWRASWQGCYTLTSVCDQGLE